MLVFAEPGRDVMSPALLDEGVLYLGARKKCVCGANPKRQLKSRYGGGAKSRKYITVEQCQDAVWHAAYVESQGAAQPRSKKRRKKEK